MEWKRGPVDRGRDEGRAKETVRQREKPKLEERVEGYSPLLRQKKESRPD